MAEQLPWFPFFVGKWMTNDEVLELSGDQMAAYLWLLCLQWQHGSLPYEAHRVIPMVPRNIPDTAITYSFLKFFPPDPDTNERRNPFLAMVREKQWATYNIRVANIAAGRKARQDTKIASPLSYEASYEDKREIKKEKEKEDVGVPQAILTSAAGYLLDPKTRVARLGLLRSLVQGMTDRPVPEAVLVRALEDMAVAGADFRPVVLKTWCDRAVKLLEGEAGKRAALDALKPIRPVSGQPDANQTPSGWAEDEAES